MDNARTAADSPAESVPHRARPIRWWIALAILPYIVVPLYFYYMGGLALPRSSMSDSASLPPLPRRQTFRNQSPAAEPPVATPTATEGSPAPLNNAAAGDKVRIGIAYGTEKRNWLEWAVKEFAASREGSRIEIELLPMGSLEGAHAVIDGDRRVNVWSPASSLYRESFLRDWEAKHRGNPILKEDLLALTPMALVMWKTRQRMVDA